MSLSSLRGLPHFNIDALRHLVRHHHRASLATGALLLVATAAPAIVRDYHAYLALGVGGFPHNALGWLMSCATRLLAAETTSTEQYAADANQRAWLAPDAVPQRDGPRPRIGSHPVPHRQLDQLTSAEIAATLPEIVLQTAAANHHAVELKTSVHERHTQALFLARSHLSPHPVADRAWREIAHVHSAADCSLHVVLAPADCKTVIEKGWAERHPCSGRVVGLPKEYLMVYAPRTADEVEVITKVLKAACGYMTDEKIE